MQYRTVFLVLLLLDGSFLCTGFSTAGVVRAKASARSGSPLLYAHSKKSGGAKNNNGSFLMDKYRDPSTGEVMDPYSVLKITRSADRQEIKNAYRAHSRRYHPDVLRFRDVLPGSCNNLEDVRDQWERVKLSYEILSDPLSRKRYDRNEALADPGKTVQRAASQAAVDAAVSVGKGIWGLGATVVREAAKAAAKAAAAHAQTESRNNSKKEEARMMEIGKSTRLVKRRPALIDMETRRRYLELAMRERIDDSMEVARTTKGLTLFSKADKNNRGLRSAGSLNAASPKK